MIIAVLVTAIVAAIAGGLYLATHSLPLMVAGVAALWFCYWAVVPKSKVPRFRVQYIKLRLRLRLHPGRGFATALEIGLHWGRLASFGASSRTRPGLSRWQRARCSAYHSVFLGRAQYRLGMRLPIQEHLVMFGPPRAYKSGFLARAIAGDRGAVVSTSTKGDMLDLTAGVRQHRGSPIYVFNPQRLGGLMSNIRWNLVAGCRVPSVAIRRAQALCEAVSTEGTEEATFWSGQAAMQMRALLCAADLLGVDFRYVNHWILSGETRRAEQALIEAGHVTWAATLRQMRSGKAEKTTATIRLVLSDAVSFMSDPALAECVIPGPGDDFSIERFLAESGSLYLIGEQRGQQSPIAPLFASLVTEIHFMASQIAASSKGRRLDPPLLLALDEVTQIVPIPLPSIVADSGGRGQQLIIAAHGIAQLRSRWDKDGAQVVLDCCNIMLNPGVKDVETLELIGQLAGKAPFKVRGSDKDEELPIIPVEAIRQLPPKRTLLIRSWRAPVIVRLAMGWRDWRYLLACVRGYAEAEVAPASALSAAAVGAMAALAHAYLEDQADMEPNVEVSKGHEDNLVGDGEIEAPRPQLPSVPPQARYVSADPAPNGHGNGHGNGNGNGHAGHTARDPWGGEL